MLEWRTALRQEQHIERTFNRDLYIAQNLDAADPLRTYRKEFYFPKDGKLYMDGNSLGLLSKPAERSLLKLLKQWKEHGIRGWTDKKNPWFYLPEKMAEIEAQLIGAEKEEVILANSTSVNLNQILTTFYEPRGKTRKSIISDESSFPTDIYAIWSRMLNSHIDPEKHLLKVPVNNGFIEEDDIIAMMEANKKTTSMLVLPTVIYTTGQLLDIKRITEEAHARGILVCFDASHSIGAVPHNFDEWGVDFAVWCNYKYLNGGPGAIGGMYVNKKHLGARPGIAGWFGSDKSKQFNMSHTPQYADSASAYQIGTPQLLSLAPLEGSLEMFGKIGMAAIREKSLKLTDFGMAQIQKHLTGLGFSIGTPENHDRRGGHIALEHPHAKQITQALIDHGVIPDFRPPNIIRLAPIALYTSYEDVYHTVQIIKEIMETKEYLRYPEEMHGVT